MIKFLMKKVLVIALSVLLFSVLFLMLRTGREKAGDLQIKGSSFIEDIRILQKKNGMTVWTLTANKADFVEGEDKAKMSDITMVIQKKNVVLHADRGIYNLSERSFATDSIVNAESKDFRIKADSIDYDVASGKIRTDGKIEVEGKGFRVEGKGMDAETGQKVRVLNDVKATFHK